MRRSNRLTNTTNHINKAGIKDSNNKVSRVIKEHHQLGHVIWVKQNPSSWWLGQVVDEKTVSKKMKPKKKLVGDVLVRLYGSYTYLYTNPEKYNDELKEVLARNNGSTREMFENVLEKEISKTVSVSTKRKTVDDKENAGDEAPKDKKSKQNGVGKNQGNIGNVPKVGTRVLRPRKVAVVVNLPEKLEGPMRTKMQVHSGGISSGRTKKEASKNEVPQQDGVKMGHKDSHGSEKETLTTSKDLGVRRVRVMQSLGLLAPSDSPFKQKLAHLL